MQVSPLAKWCAPGLFVAVLFLPGAGSSAEEVYKATLTSPKRLGKKTAFLTLTVKQTATEEDAAKFRKMLKEQSADEVVEALRRNDWGVAKIKDGPSSVITYARAFPGQNGSRVIVVTAEPLYFPGDAEGSVNPGNAVGLIQLEVASTGKGRGTLAAALKVRITDEGVFEVEASRAEPIDLVNVQREK